MKKSNEELKRFLVSGMAIIENKINIIEL